MTTFGMPTPMFLVFVATVLAGSLGAIHYVVVHVIMGRPFAEVLPPVLRDSDAAGDVPPAGVEAPRAGEGRPDDAGDARG